MEANQKSSGTPESWEVILLRIQMLAEGQIPDEVSKRFLKTDQEADIFLTVADPDQWPASMQPFRKWIEDNVPPEYWAEFEEKSPEDWVVIEEGSPEYWAAIKEK